MKKIFFLLAILISQLALGQTDLPVFDGQDDEEKEFVGVRDTVVIEPHPFNQQALDSLQMSPEFDYKQPPTVAETLWQRFWRWVNELLSNLIQGAVETDVGRLLVYILAFIVVVVIIMALLKVNALKMFYTGSDAGQMRGAFFEENIHEMNFEKLIEEATAKQEYRQATRLILLYALKMLADRHLIQWQAGKTNHDYVEELKAGEVKVGLNELSFYFDYAWYGNFKINTQTFAHVQNTFANWRQKLNP
ncbi:MAG: DUF4129 domain-containing protein [Bacteroidota bacterium]|nr:DUF4129 domain-containing protein [Cytophagales bacterium]MCE2956653.1 DUF4129 domain-containing protein [Flammeovirgaceae bacterium]